MPRDSSGVYTLPPGNPVVTNTLIASTWANPTMSDIAAQLNNVLTRDGLLGPTGPFKLQDGTVAAPGLAFASEVGLGWYRAGAGLIGMAQGGIARAMFDFSAAKANLSLNAGGGVAAELKLNKGSSGVASNIWGLMNGTSRWAMSLGDGTAESGSNVGSNFQIFRYNDAGVFIDTPLAITRSTGAVNVGSPAGLQITDPTGSGGSAKIQMFTPGGLKQIRVNASNSLDILNSVLTTAILTLQDSGSLSITGNFLAGINLGLIDDGSASTYLRWAQNGWRLQFYTATGTMGYLSSANQQLFLFAADGNASKLGAGTAWGNISDKRIKKDIEDWDGGLTEVLSLRPRMFTRIDTNERAIGCVADEAEIGFPALIKRGPGKIGDVEYEDRAMLHIDPLFWALVNSTKELNARISQLESQAAGA